MRRLLLVATAAVAVLMVPSTAAQACDGVGYQDVGGTGVYVTDDFNWIYVETNGVGGLQRGQGGTVDSTQVYSAEDCASGDGTPDSKLY